MLRVHKDFEISDGLIVALLSSFVTLSTLYRFWEHARLSAEFYSASRAHAAYASRKTTPPGQLIQL